MAFSAFITVAWLIGTFTMCANVAAKDKKHLQREDLVLDSMNENDSDHLFNHHSRHRDNEHLAKLPSTDRKSAKSAESDRTSPSTSAKPSSAVSSGLLPGTRMRRIDFETDLLEPDNEPPSPHLEEQPDVTRQSDNLNILTKSKERNLQGPEDKLTVNSENFHSQRRVSFDFESMETRSSGRKGKGEITAKKNWKNSVPGNLTPIKTDKATGLKTGNEPSTTIPIVPAASITVLPSRVRLKPTLRARFMDIRENEKVAPVTGSEECSSSPALPCSLGFGKNCMLGFNEDGCKVCRCPKGSPAAGCAGPNWPLEPTSEWIQMLTGRKRCPNGRIPQKVTRYYRKTSNTGDYCHPIQGVYCGWEEDEHRRMPRSKGDCYFYCFNQDELDKMNIKV